MPGLFNLFSYLTLCNVTVMESKLVCVCVCVCVLQAEERRAGAEDVVSAREPEGTDGTAGGTDETAQGDTHTLTQTHKDSSIIFQH